MNTGITYSRLFIGLSTFLYLLAPLYFDFNVGGSGLNLPFNYLVWSAAVLVILLAMIKIMNNGKILLPGNWMMVVMAAGILTLLGFVSQPVDNQQWMIRIGYLYGGLLFFAAIYQFELSQKQNQAILVIIVVSAIAQAIIGLFQIYQIKALHGWFPWSYNQLPYGIFQQQNVAASFMATGALCAAYLSLTTSPENRFNGFNLLTRLSIFFLSVMIFASGSRVGILGLVSGVVLLFCASTSITAVIKNHSRQILLALIGCAVLVSFLPSNNSAQLSKKLSQIDSRIAVYDITWQLIKEKPWFGHGIGSFKAQFQQQRIEYEKNHPEMPIDHRPYTHPHNEFLYWAAETGVISWVAFFIFVMFVCRQLLQNKLRVGLVYAGLLLPISLHTLVEMPFYHSSVHWFVWLYLLSMMSSKTSGYR